MNQPNFLIIQSDQHRFDCVGANGHPLLKTPNMDRLAAEGMNFSHAFCPIPMCVPARITHLTGQWPARNTRIVNYDGEGFRPFESIPQCFSHVLKEAGYELSYVGRWHVDPVKTPVDFGFGEYIPDWQYGKWRERQGLPNRPRDKGWLGQPDPFITPEQSALAWGADRTIEQMKRLRAAGKPFFLRWDMIEPHLANHPPEPYASMFKPGEIPPWPGSGDALEGKPYIQAQQRRTWQVEHFTWQDWAPVVSLYLGDIALLDAQIGRVLDALEELGLADDTLVVYTSDHGDMCGSHGMIDKHYIMYDDVVRVPFIARWPGVIQPGKPCPAFISNSLDLAATYCDLAGAGIPEQFQGQSLRPLFEGAATKGREDIMSMYHGNQFGLFSQRMLRDRRWKYVWNLTAEDELYDLESDPGEHHNRARDPACAEELGRLRRRLAAWLRETGDILLNNWTKRQLLEDAKI